MPILAYEPSPADLFATICQTMADRIAIKAAGFSLSYGALDKRTERRAAWLAGQGVKRLDRVGIRVDDPYDFVEAVVACVRLGVVYVPIDSRMAPQAARHALEAARIDHLITDTPSVSEWVGDVPVLGPPPADFQGHNVDSLRGVQDPQEPVCIMFTSGSTGVPKGVVCPLGGIVPLCTGDSYLPIACDDVVLQISAREFDAFTWEIWGAFLNGACLYLLPPRWSVSDLGRHIADGQVTTAFFTARLFDMLIESAPETLANMRLIGFGGEPASPRHCVLARRLLPQTLLINGYGPTENTTFTCSYVLGEAADDEEQVPVGTSKRGDIALLLDPESLEPIEGTGVGELFVGGPGLALGYTDDALTAQRFIHHPTLGLRLFRTGDRVERRTDGRFLCLGRLDRQVKVIGHRVDLFDVEQALCRHPDILSANVVFEEMQGRSELIAFIRTEGDAPIDRRLLVDFLADNVVPYAVPHRFEQVSVPPLKQNGKLDVAAMVAQFKARAGRAQSDDPLIALWARLLHPTPISETTNFFDEGGDSLAALNLVLETERLFSVSLPTDYIMHNPVLADFRRNLLSAPVGGLVTPAIVPDGRPLLVLVPWLDGLPIIFRHFFPYLRFAGQIVCLDLALYVEERGAVRSVRDISRACADALAVPGISTVSLVGPSLGGSIALDLAAELEQRGVRVDKVVMLDSYAPWLVVRYKLREKFDAFLGRPAPTFAIQAPTIQPTTIQPTPIFRRFAPAEAPAGSGARSLGFVRRKLGRLFTFHRMRPRIPAAAAIHLIEAEQLELTEAMHNVPHHGWQRAVPQLRVSTAPGGHLTMLERANGPVLAGLVSTLLAPDNAMARFAVHHAPPDVLAIRQPPKVLAGN